MVNNTRDNVDKLYESLVKIFKALKYTISVGSDSKTDFGHSRYMYVNYKGRSTKNYSNGLKVRVSDHSVFSNNRLIDEYHFLVNLKGSIDLYQLKSIELELKPESFKVVKLKQNKTRVLQVGGNEYHPTTDKILSKRNAKRGGESYTVERTTIYNYLCFCHKKDGFMIGEYPISKEAAMNEFVGKYKKPTKRKAVV